MTKYCRVRTFHGSVLLASDVNGYIAAGQAGLIGTVPVIACLPANSAHCAYLGADVPAGVLPRLLPLATVGRIIPVGMTDRSADSSVAFFSPWTGKFLVAAPHLSSTSTGHAILGAQEPRDYEKLYLDEVSEEQVPPYLLTAAALLNRLSKPTPTCKAVAEFLGSVPPSSLTADVLNAAGLLLSRREIALLGMRISSSETMRSLLADHFSDDLFAQHAIGPLVKWLYGHTAAEPRPGSAETLKPPAWYKKIFRKRRVIPRSSTQVDCNAEARSNLNIKEIGPELDKLDTVGLGGQFVSLPFACNVSIRQHVESRRRTCVIATARNEGLYLLEWLAHHRAMGFEGFFIYSNGNTDGSDGLLHALAEAGEITWVNNVLGPGTRPQWKAYNHALQVDPAVLDYEWALVIDLDEHFNLNPEHFSSIQDYLDWAERSVVDSIAFNWLVVGSNGETHWRDDLLRKRFPSTPLMYDDGNYASNFIKSMFRPRKFPVAMPHHPVAFRDENVVFRAPSMESFSYNPHEGPGKSTVIDCRLAWVAHYFFKSNEEFVYKFSRPRGDDPTCAEVEFSALTAGFVLEFIKSSKRRSIVKQTVKLDDSIRVWLDRFLAIAAVRDASSSVKRFYERRLDTLLPKLVFSRGILEAGDAGQAFIAPLVQRSQDPERFSQGYALNQP